MTHKKILMDTSAWIWSFKSGGAPPILEQIKANIASGLIVTSPLIILELMQGCRTQKEKDLLQIRLESLEQLVMTNEVWDKSYRIAFQSRRNGLTIPTVDILIASLCLVNRCKLLHCDRHFGLVAKLVENFEQFHIKE